MDKRGFNKFIAVVVLLIVLTLVKSWFSFSYALVWLGVLVGFYLPIIDHIIYAYVLRPELEVSGHIRSLISIKKVRELVSYINQTESERQKLIIHTCYFQVVFLILTFFILTSSSSLFGRGLVYGFSLALFVEQFFYFRSKGNLDSWFSEMKISLDTNKTKLYLYTIGFVIFILLTIL